MAAPQVAAVGAMMRALNPYASLTDLLEIIKRTAQRPAGTGWSSDNGWGILNAGAALDATRRLDRLAPVSRISAPHVTTQPTVLLRWSGHDQRHAPLTTSGIAYYLVFDVVFAMRLGDNAPTRAVGAFRVLAHPFHPQLHFGGGRPLHPPESE